MLRKSGRLLYVIGASGAGKDSLLNYARQQLKHIPTIAFAHRYITRPASTDGENHIALSNEEFMVRVRNGMIVMHWQSHGNHYGVGSEINSWLANGIEVVVNGSREYLPTAAKLFPEIHPVLINVSEKVLLRRLLGRNRESTEEIAARINRSRQISIAEEWPNIHIINNDCELENAGEELIEFITMARESECV
ncbi:MAG: phosphonate metabolism protein/1,5-bisphosphokinase (PRPP-forming) PhnN [Desulfuromonadales bacterium]|nr:phosphonate metabolism protein/1,5-bisphosphokinase (PRPP-forming) PhnN [Desulfuromonadales bacterium]